jgi:hypothetical protein
MWPAALATGLEAVAAEKGAWAHRAPAGGRHQHAWGAHTLAPAHCQPVQSTSFPSPSLRLPPCLLLLLLTHTPPHLDGGQLPEVALQLHLYSAPPVRSIPHPPPPLLPPPPPALSTSCSSHTPPLPPCRTLTGASSQKSHWNRSGERMKALTAWHHTKQRHTAQRTGWVSAPDMYSEWESNMGLRVRQNATRVQPQDPLAGAGNNHRSHTITTTPQRHGCRLTASAPSHLCCNGRPGFGEVGVIGLHQRHGGCDGAQVLLDAGAVPHHLQREAVQNQRYIQG